jgi:hypothetical protein
MMSRERKIRPAMTNGWFESDIAVNLGNFSKLSRHDAVIARDSVYWPHAESRVQQVNDVHSRNFPP